MEVRVARIDAAQTVLAHENGGVRVLHDVACQLRLLLEQLLDVHREVLRVTEHVGSRRE